MFPPANVGTLHLECWFVSDDYDVIMNPTNDITVYNWRIYPHRQNTGSSFHRSLGMCSKAKNNGDREPQKKTRKTHRLKANKAVVRPPFGPVVRHAGEGVVAQAGS